MDVPTSSTAPSISSGAQHSPLPMAVVPFHSSLDDLPNTSITVAPGSRSTGGFRTETISGDDVVLAEKPERSHLSGRKEDEAIYLDAGATDMLVIANPATSDPTKSEDATAAMTVTNGDDGKRQGFAWQSLEGSLASLHNKVDALSMRLSSVEGIVEILIQQKAEVDDNFARVQEVLKEIEARVRGNLGAGTQNYSNRHGDGLDSRIEKTLHRDSTVSEEFDEKTVTTVNGRIKASTREYQSKRKAQAKPPTQRRSKRSKTRHAQYEENVGPPQKTEKLQDDRSDDYVYQWDELSIQILSNPKRASYTIGDKTETLAIGGTVRVNLEGYDEDGMIKIRDIYWAHDGTPVIDGVWWLRVVEDMGIDRLIDLQKKVLEEMKENDTYDKRRRALILGSERFDRDTIPIPAILASEDVIILRGKNQELPSDTFFSYYYIYETQHKKPILKEHSTPRLQSPKAAKVEASYAEMIAELESLHGSRQSVDVEWWKKVVVNNSDVASACPEIVEMLLNEVVNPGLKFGNSDESQLLLDFLIEQMWEIGKDKLRLEKTELGEYQCILSREIFNGTGYYIYGINLARFFPEDVPKGPRSSNKNVLSTTSALKIFYVRECLAYFKQLIFEDLKIKREHVQRLVELSSRVKKANLYRPQARQTDIDRANDDFVTYC